MISKCLAIGCRDAVAPDRFGSLTPMCARHWEMMSIPLKAFVTVGVEQGKYTERSRLVMSPDGKRVHDVGWH